MSRDDDRDGPDPRRSTGGNPVLLILLLVGGLFAVLALVAVVGMGFLFMARSAEMEHAEMRMVMEEQRAIAESENRAVSASRIYTREGFKSVVTGKTEQEVEDTLGKPTRIVQDGPTSHWEYEKRTFEATTGTTDPTVKVTFFAGRVTAVIYPN